MNINASGIINKIKANADWTAAILSYYDRMGTDFGAWLDYAIRKDGLQFVVQDSFKSLDNIKHKLFHSDHLSSTMFKGALLARLLVEIGIVPPKYKKLTEKVMWGSGIAALTLPGSGPEAAGQPYRGDMGTHNASHYPRIPVDPYRQAGHNQLGRYTQVTHPVAGAPAIISRVKGVPRPGGR